MSAFRTYRGIVPILCFLVGCGGSDPRLEISGKVILHNEPLDHGQIEFLPLQPGSSFRAGATIKDGEYAVPKEFGLLPGIYKVVIRSSVMVPNPAGADRMPIAKERIPAAYSSQSKNTVEIQSGQKNQFDFKIE